MKVRSILASLGACAIAVSAMATTAFAGEVPLVNGTEADGKYVYSVGDHLPTGKKITDVYGAKVVISGVNTEAGAGGGIIFQSESAGWNQKEWGNEGSEKPYVYNYTDFTFTRLETETPFAETDTWASVVISQWADWGDAVKIESVTLLGKDGKELTAGATDDTPATTTTTQQAVISPNNNKNNNNNTKTTGAKTGDTGVGVAVAGLALAGIGIVVTRKKH